MSIPSRPADMGYWIGKRICEAYYAKAGDKRAAMRTLLELRDPKAILAKSGYGRGLRTEIPDVKIVDTTGAAPRAMSRIFDTVPVGRPSRKEFPMDLTFRKELVGDAPGPARVYGYYFSMVLPTDAVNVMPQHMVLFGGGGRVPRRLAGRGRIHLAIVDPRDETDERDRLIELKERAWALVLAAGVFTSLVVAVQTQGNFLFTHVLLGSWVLAQLVETGSQLYLYRRGA
jgi:hypothetical protein